MIPMYGQAAVDLVKRSEGLRLSCYADAVGIQTVCWGHVLRNGEPRDCTLAQCEDFLAKDLTTAWDAVRRNVRVDLTQGQVDALVSFVFNMGERSLQNSTLLRKLNAGDADGAAAEFTKWNHAGGQVLAGLTTRREAEQDLFIA